MESNPYANLEAMREIEEVPTPEPNTMNDPAFRHLLSTVQGLQIQSQADREESRRKEDQFREEFRLKDEESRRRDEEYRQIIQNLAGTIHASESSKSTAIELTSTRRATKTAKLRDPEPFMGKPAKLFNFLADCRLKFRMEPQQFVTEFEKIGWAATHLGGIAKTWWTTSFTAFESGNHQIPELESFTAFAAKLNHVFGDPDLVRTKTGEIHSLRQTTSVAHYATEFTAISQFLDWSDATLKYQFELGLKADVKDALSYIPIAPATLRELIDIANKVDIRRHEHRQAIKRSTNTTSMPATRTIANKSAENKTKSVPSKSWAHPASTRQAAAPITSKPTLPMQTSDGTTPMEIDSTGRKVLAASEKQRRFDNNLCMYCGDSNHRVSTCPKVTRINAVFPPAFITEIDTSDSSSTNDSAQE